ncbi:hypothetical protein JZ751_011444 [Albula glossodonta]|uniref:Uncharacterized protein n=1 Tax=Albula glossodonta TaxID=121402 RepID=A0A8T2NAH6_9TELE|nr:hypothetical protein JZ751_011444 [Albula glossodonta]
MTLWSGQNAALSFQPPAPHMCTSAPCEYVKMTAVCSEADSCSRVLMMIHFSVRLS